MDLQLRVSRFRAQVLELGLGFVGGIFPTTENKQEQSKTAWTLGGFRG